MPPLHSCVMRHDIPGILAGVKSQGTHIDLKDEAGQTALHWAARLGYMDVVRLLVDLGAKTQESDLEGNLALHIAASQGHLPVLLQLLPHDANGANTQNVVSGDTALHLAAAAGHADIVRTLLSHGADRSRANNRGKVPYDYAVNSETRMLLAPSQPQGGATSAATQQKLQEQAKRGLLPDVARARTVHEVAARALLEASRNRAIEEEARLAREVSLLDSFLEGTLMGSLAGSAAPAQQSAAVLQANLAQEEELARWRQEQSARQARRDRRQQRPPTSLQQQEQPPKEQAQQDRSAGAATDSTAAPAAAFPAGASSAEPGQDDPLALARDAAFRRQMDAAAYLKDKTFPLEVLGGGAFAVPGGAVLPSQRPTIIAGPSPSLPPSPTPSASPPPPSPSPPPSFRAGTASPTGLAAQRTHSPVLAQAEEMLAAVQRNVNTLSQVDDSMLLQAEAAMMRQAEEAAYRATVEAAGRPSSWQAASAQKARVPGAAQERAAAAATAAVTAALASSRIGAPGGVAPVATRPAAQGGAEAQGRQSPQSPVSAPGGALNAAFGSGWANQLSDPASLARQKSADSGVAAPWAEANARGTPSPAPQDGASGIDAVAERAQRAREETARTLKAEADRLSRMLNTLHGGAKGPEGAPAGSRPQAAPAPPAAAGAALAQAGPGISSEQGQKNGSGQQQQQQQPEQPSGDQTSGGAAAGQRGAAAAVGTSGREKQRLGRPWRSVRGAAPGPDPEVAQMEAAAAAADAAEMRRLEAQAAVAARRAEAAAAAAAAMAAADRQKDAPAAAVKPKRRARRLLGGGGGSTTGSDSETSTDTESLPVSMTTTDASDLDDVPTPLSRDASMNNLADARGSPVAGAPLRDRDSAASRSPRGGGVTVPQRFPQQGSPEPGKQASPSPSPPNGAFAAAAAAKAAGAAPAPPPREAQRGGTWSAAAPQPAAAGPVPASPARVIDTPARREPGPEPAATKRGAEEEGNEDSLWRRRVADARAASPLEFSSSPMGDSKFGVSFTPGVPSGLNTADFAYLSKGTRTAKPYQTTGRSQTPEPRPLTPDDSSPLQFSTEGMSANEAVRARAEYAKAAAARAAKEQRDAYMRSPSPATRRFGDTDDMRGGLPSVDALRRQRERQAEEARRHERTVSPLRDSPADLASLPSLAAPTLLSKTESLVSVKWGPSKTGSGVPASLYELQIATFGQPWTTVSAVLTDTSLSVAELEPATPYIFRVRGRGTFAWGPFSNASEAFTTMGEPLVSSPGGGGSPEAALEEALLSVRKEIWALKYLPAESARTAVRKLKMRYHPDKAPPDRRELFLELSKHINTETASLVGA